MAQSMPAGVQLNWQVQATFPAYKAETPNSDDSSSSDRGSETRTDRKDAPQKRKDSFRIGFQFVNVSHPSEARGKSSKSAIRSHVAREQHSRVQVSASVSSKPTTKRSRARKQTKGAQAGNEVVPEVIVTSLKSSETSLTETSELSKTSTESEEDVIDISDVVVRQEPRRTPSPNARTAMLSRILRGGRHDPFWTYPVPFHSYLEEVVDHYLVNIAVDIPNIDSLTERGLLRKQWFPLCMTEPAVFYAVMLMAASHFAIMNVAMAQSINLMLLKGRAIQAINHALQDPVRSTSDSVIGAVMKMAAYEAIFGDTVAYKAHMSGLQKMILLRGGLPTLGMNGLLERMVLWIDCNASQLLGCDWTFDKRLFPTTVSHPPADLLHFAGISE